MPQTSTLPHIIIIGAGISGLAAAKTLFPYRCRLTVLEARDRIGGRAYTNHSHGIPIDCGASWIHGFSDENPLTAVAKRGGLRTYTGGESLSFNKRGGEPMPDEYAEELNGELFDLLYAARTYVKKNWHTIPLTMSFEDFIEMYLKDLEKKDPASWTREKIADLRSLSLYFEGYDATENVKQSLKYLDTEIRFEGENCFLPDGYDMLTRTYAEDVIKSNMIKLGEIVKRIEYNETSARITTTANKIYDADAVIITLPLGVLKTIDAANGSMPLITFSPQLPEPKLHAIRSLGFGTLDKAILTFREGEPCWPKDKDFIITLPTESRTSSKSPSPHVNGIANGHVNGIVNGHANGHANGYANGYANGHANGHANGTNDPIAPHLAFLNRHMISYCSMVPMHPTAPHPILVAYYSEQVARHVERIHPASLLAPLFHAHLRQFFPALKLEDLISADITRWNTDPFALGSYTHIPIGGATPADLDVWDRPVKGVGSVAKEVQEGEDKEGVLYWAGEHTIRHFASMHGALMSGEREGLKVAKRFGLNVRTSGEAPLLD